MFSAILVVPQQRIKDIAHTSSKQSDEHLTPTSLAVEHLLRKVARLPERHPDE